MENKLVTSTPQLYTTVTDAYPKTLKSNSISVAPPEVRLLSVVQNEKLLGNVVHHEIRNLSKWYRNRRLLGTKLHSAQSIKRVEGKKLFKASIYECRVRRNKKSQTNLVPFRRELGVYKSYNLALKACDRAIAARDYGDSDESRIEATHFFLLIVADAFEHLTHTKRLELVFEALLSEFSVDRGGGGRPSYFLQELRLLWDMKFHLLLELRSTKQWNANLRKVDSITNIYNARSLCFQSQERWSYRFPDDITANERNLHLRANQDHSLSLNQEPTWKRKTCYRLNKTSADGQKKDKVKKRNDVLLCKKKQRYPLLICDDFDEREVIAKYEYLFSEISSSAIRMQRMYRLKLLPRIELKQYKRRQLALMIQRSTRGRLARKMNLYGTLGYWSKKHCRLAVLIQKTVRRLLSSTEVSKIKKRSLIHCINSSASKIQAVARCYIAREICKGHFALYFFQYKTIPSIILLQAMWRRKMSQYDVDAIRNQEFSTMLIQLHVRRMLCQHWLSVMVRKKRYDACATKIKKLFRAAVCRANIHQLVEECYVQCIKIPNLIRIQSQCRIYKCRNNLFQKRMAAKKIQCFFRVHWSILVIECMRYVSARKVQAFFRMFIQQQQHRLHLISHKATRLYASRCISSLWLNYRHNVHVRSMKECASQKSHSTLLAHLLKQQSDVQNELRVNLNEQGVQEMSSKLYRVRRHIIKKEIEMARKRAGEVERELDVMQLMYGTTEGREKDPDIAQWMQFFSIEIVETRNQIEMGLEELHGCSIHMDGCVVSTGVF